MGARAGLQLRCLPVFPLVVSALLGSVLGCVYERSRSKGRIHRETGRELLFSNKNRSPRTGEKMEAVLACSGDGRVANDHCS